MKTYKKDKCVIEDIVTQAEIERFYSENDCADVGKTLTAKLLCNAIEAKSFIPSQNVINNFQGLFERIFSYLS